MTDHAEVIQRIDKLIRDAKVPSALILFNKLASRNLPRSVRVQVAELAMRIGRPEIALRLLHAWVRPGGRLRDGATVAEKAVYALALTRIGAIEESLALMQTLDPKKYRRVSFFRAAALISHWGYAEALPHLQRYLDDRSLPIYRRWVGELNLAACFIVVGKHRDATSLLRRLLYHTSLRKLGLLHANALELLAQNYYGQRRWKEAQDAIRRAEKAAPWAGTLDMLWLRKWRAFLAFAQKPESRAASEELDTFREQALAFHDWESLRDCDRQEAIIKKDRRLLWRVYAGTPYPAFRKLLLAEFPDTVEMPSSVVWAPGNATKGTLDLTKVDQGMGEDALRTGSLVHRFLCALCVDFYRPMRLPTLFEKVYPGEFFHPERSASRIHEGVKRLREWLRARGLPIEVERSTEGYRLLLKGCAIRMPLLDGRSNEVIRDPAERLREKFCDGAFTAREGATYLDFPLRTTQRMLESLRDESKVARSGAGPATRYRFVHR